jgi:hypothetical protein
MAAILPNRNLCLQALPDCLVCLTASSDACSFCRPGFYLHRGLCLQQCPNGTAPYRYQRVCVQQNLASCLREVTERAYWTFSKTSANQNADGLLYLLSVNFQLTDPLNDPVGSVFIYSSKSSSRAQLGPRSVNIASSYQRCELCRPGYGLAETGGCSPCLAPCLECTFASAAYGACLRCDSFHRLVSSSCVRLDPTEMPCLAGEFRNENLMCQSRCLQFYRPDQGLSSNGLQVNCTANCPQGRRISRQGSQQEEVLRCEVARDGQEQWVKLLGSRVPISNGTLYFFVTSERLTLRSGQMGTAIPLESSQRLLQGGGPSELIATELGFIVVDPSRSPGVLIALDPVSIQSAGGLFLGNSQYAIDSGTVAPIDLILTRTGGLYGYGRAMVVLLLCATVVFAGNQLAYKADNVWITFGVLYLLLPSLNLAPDSSFHCYSFLYGFAWSTGLELFSDPRGLSQGVSWFDGYLELPNSSAHYALFVDNNLLRNGWSIFLFLAFVGLALALLILVFRCFSVRRQPFVSSSRLGCVQEWLLRWRGMGKGEGDFDHSTAITHLLLFVIENSFLGLSYYSVMNLFNPAWRLASSSQLLPYRLLSGGLLLAMLGYTLVRWQLNAIAGLYCCKRLTLGTVLAYLSSAGGVDRNLPVAILLLVAAEFLFLLLRYRYELLANYLALVCCSEKAALPLKPARSIQTRHSLPERVSSEDLPAS